MYRNLLRSLAVLFFCLLFTACATSLNEELELSKFALDHGDWEAAIAHGKNALADDPSSALAGIYLADGYTGRAGISITKISAVIADAATKEDLFDAIHDGLVLTIKDMEDLSRAIDTLENGVTPGPATSDRFFIDFYFQLAMLSAIEAYGKPALLSQPEIDGPVDVKNITEDVRETVSDDLLVADNYLEETGIDPSNELFRHIRQTYCVLKNASSSASGFDLPALRDMVLCQLSPDDGAALLPSAFESPKIASCSDLDYGACENTGPTEP